MVCLSFIVHMFWVNSTCVLWIRWHLICYMELTIFSRRSTVPNYSLNFYSEGPKSSKTERLWSLSRNLRTRCSTWTAFQAVPTLITGSNFGQRCCNDSHIKSYLDIEAPITSIQSQLWTDRLWWPHRKSNYCHLNCSLHLKRLSRKHE